MQTLHFLSHVIEHRVLCIHACVWERERIKRKTEGEKDREGREKKKRKREKVGERSSKVGKAPSKSPTNNYQNM